MKNSFVSVIASATVLWALYLAAPLLPRGTTWGFHFLEFLDPLAPVGFIIIGVLLFITVVKQWGIQSLSRCAAWTSSHPLILPFCFLPIFAAMGLLFRVRVPLLGDSWFLVRNFADAIQGTDVILPRDEPLATYYFSAVTGLFGVNTYSGFLDAFFAADMLLGAGFILVAWSTVRAVFTAPLERLVSFFIVCTLPAMLLFFGYVETYSAVLFVLSLYVLAGVFYLRGRLPFAFVALAFLLQLLTHYLTLLTLPSLAYLVYAGWKRGDSRQLMVGVAAFAVTVLLVLASIGFNVENYFSQVPHKHVLPLVTPDAISERYSSPYTMFSPYHFTDLANLAFLLAGAAAILLVAAFTPGVRMRKDTTSAAAGWRSEIEKFLIVAAGPIVLFTLVAKFDLGTARDWDVVAPYSYILTLFALTAYFRRVPSATDSRPVLLAGGMSLICSLLWFTVNASPAWSVERFTGLLDPGLIGQGGMYNGSLYLSRYYAQVGIGEERSAELWENYVNLYPGDLRGYRNVIANMKSARAESVTGTLRGWLHKFGENPVTKGSVVGLSLESGNFALDQNRLGDAGRFYTIAVSADSGSAAAWNNLGIVRARGGDFGEARGMFMRAVEIDTSFADAWFNLGRAQVALGDLQRGRHAFVLSARFGNDAARKILSETPGGK